jgi:hypothetical protein
VLVGDKLSDTLYILDKYAENSTESNGKSAKKHQQKSKQINNNDYKLWQLMLCRNEG